MRRFLLIILAVAAGFLPSAWAQATEPQPWRVEQVVDVGPAFSALPVGFDLLTHGEHQFVAYYGPDRWLHVAGRRLGETTWTRARLPERFPWDSHNGVVMAVDDRGHLHLAANMHGDSLNYYRTAAPLDVTSFVQRNRMTGRDEDRCTYPQFLTAPDGRLVFYYRDGGSGNGRRIFNVYDASGDEWRRLLDEPLLDGRAHSMNAYPVGPVRGPDGAFHLIWMWRDTPDAATNHSLSYIRSRDLVHWTTADGAPLTLPVTPADPAAVVDPVPPREGLINMGFAIGFDRSERLVVAYHKYDADGHSQIYNARWEGDRWQRYQTSDWSERWDFGGGGSIPSLVGAGPVRVLDGRLVQDYHHWLHGAGTWHLDPETLRPVGEVEDAVGYPPELERVRSEVPGMRVRWASDAHASAGGVRHVLRWETLDPNRDRPRPDPLPPPTTLQVIMLVER